MKDFIIRKMTTPEFDLALDWATLEGWNPGLFDAIPFRNVDPDGLLIGLIDDEPVAVISATRYNDFFGFIGFYIVRPDCRGQGFGWKIWQAGMAHLGSRTIGLDGVLEQQGNYHRSGFKLVHRNIRYQGISEKMINTKNLRNDREILSLQEAPLDKLLEYDRNFFPANRHDFLLSWISQPETVALGLMESKKLVGYGVRRKCRNGFKIGPLFADSPDLASTLIETLCKEIEQGIPFFIDVPECNQNAISLVTSFGMKKVFETARMYTSIAPDLALSRTYGITSFELG
jgi:GNAT superfamily N-acetyltransferase